MGTSGLLSGVIGTTPVAAIRVRTFIAQLNPGNAYLVLIGSR